MITELLRIMQSALHKVRVPGMVCARISHDGSIMTAHTSKDPLHGVTLEALLTALVFYYGWSELAKRININCFKNDPSIKSSLKFLRRTPWARTEVEALYLSGPPSLHRSNTGDHDTI